LQKIRVPVAIPHGGLRTKYSQDRMKGAVGVSIPHGGLRTRQLFPQRESFRQRCCHPTPWV